MPGFAAYLRVYEPLGTLPDPDRRRWTSYVEGGDVPSRALLMAAEHAAGLAAATRPVPSADVRAAGDRAYVRHLDGLTYVCPWRLQTRVWEALEAFRSMLPDEVAAAFMPPGAIAAAEADHDAWLAAHGEAPCGIRSCTWTVPIPWFVLFEPDERRLVLGERRAAGAPPATGLDRALVYLTAMSRARRRAARALHVMQRVLGEGAAVEAVEELARWLEEFHPHSLVELDYGGLVHLLDDDALSADDSVAELSSALDALGQGDTEAAAHGYEAVLGRWRAVAALEHAN